MHPRVVGSSDRPVPLGVASPVDPVGGVWGESPGGEGGSPRKVF